MRYHSESSSAEDAASVGGGRAAALLAQHTMLRDLSLAAHKGLTDVSALSAPTGLTGHSVASCHQLQEAAGLGSLACSSRSTCPVALAAGVAGVARHKEPARAVRGVIFAFREKSRSALEHLRELDLGPLGLTLIVLTSSRRGRRLRAEVRLLRWTTDV